MPLRNRIALFLLAAFSTLRLAGAPPDDRGVVRIALVVKSSAPFHGELIARRADDAKEVRTLSVRSEEAVVFREQAGTTWELVLQGAGFWAAPLLLTIPSGETAKEMVVWPTGTLTGSAQVAGEQAGPKELQVSVETSPSRRDASIPAGTIFPCVITKKRFSCELPAATMDIAIGAKPYAPVYRWDVKVPVGRPRDLQTIVLRKGSSLLAWVSPDALKELRAPAIGRLYRAAGGGLAASRFSGSVAEVKSDSRGALHFAGIGPDTYTLVVSAEGWAPTGIYPVEIKEGASVVLRRPVTLERPFSLRLRLQPYGEERDWTAEVARVPTMNEGPSPSGSIRTKPDRTGEVLIPDMSPGTFRVTVADAAGNNLAASMLRIRGAEDAVQTIDVAGKHIHGRVTIKKEPLKAQLIFGGRSGMVQVKVQSSEDGSYDAFLPQREKWPVDINSDSPPIHTTMMVAIPADDDTVDIHLSSASIAGRVMFKGAPVIDATVRIFVGGATTVVRTDALGGYRLASVPAGPVGLMATNGRSNSRRMDLTLAEDEQREGVQLELQDVRRLRVRFLARAIPIAGARIAVHVPDGAMWHRTGVTSDLDGFADVDIPAGVTRVRFFVEVPGLSFQPLEVAVPEQPMLDVSVPADVGGTLTVIAPPNEAHTLLYAGMNVPIPELVPWILEHGGTMTPPNLVVPNLASGAYSACTRGKTPVCKEGTLAPGGTLVLDLSR